MRGRVMSGLHLNSPPPSPCPVRLSPDGPKARRPQPLLAHLLPARDPPGGRGVRVDADAEGAGVRAARGAGGAADRKPGQPHAGGTAQFRRHQPRGTGEEHRLAGIGEAAAAGAGRPVEGLRGRPLLAPRGCGTACAPRPRHHRRQRGERRHRAVGALLDRGRSVLAAGRPEPAGPNRLEHAAGVGRHRADCHHPRLCRDRTAHQPAAA